MEVTSGEGLGGDLWGEDDVEMTELRDATEVYRMHAIELTRFATALVGPSDAPDVVSDAVVSLLRSGRLAEANNQRACVFLTYWEDLSVAQVAERLGIGEGTVKRYLSRAKLRLKEVLDGA